MVPLAKFGTWSASWKKKLNNHCPCAQALCTGAFFTFYLFPYLVLRGIIIIFRAIPHNSKCRYGERGAAAAKPKAQIILDAAKVSAASGGNSEPKQGQRSQRARGFCPRSTMRVPQPDIIEHFGNADAVPQLPERCLSRKAGIVRCCLKKPWKPQRTPAALCLTSCLCLRNICHFLCFQKHLDRLLCCLASSLNRYRSSCMP